MKIEINNYRKIFAIQEEFNVLFPNVSMEFYEKSSRAGGSPSENLVKSNSKTLDNCRNTHEAGYITIVPGMTIGELKQNLRDVYGLSIDLFNKSQNDVPLGDDTILEELIVSEE